MIAHQGDDLTAASRRRFAQRSRESDDLERMRPLVDQIAGEHEDSVAGGPLDRLQACGTFDDLRRSEQFHQTMIVTVYVSDGEDVFIGIDLRDGRILCPVARDLADSERAQPGALSRATRLGR